jgi:hypothetical protein
MPSVRSLASPPLGSLRLLVSSASHGPAAPGGPRPSTAPQTSRCLEVRSRCCASARRTRRRPRRTGPDLDCLHCISGPDASGPGNWPLAVNAVKGPEPVPVRINPERVRHIADSPLFAFAIRLCLHTTFSLRHQPMAPETPTACATREALSGLLVFAVS